MISQEGAVQKRKGLLQTSLGNNQSACWNSWPIHSLNALHPFLSCNTIQQTTFTAQAGRYAFRPQRPVSIWWRVTLNNTPESVGQGQRAEAASAELRTEELVPGSMDPSEVGPGLCALWCIWGCSTEGRLFPAALLTWGTPYEQN